jgi:ABC-type antimicrobial peptide transport system permease subunit
VAKSVIESHAVAGELRDALASLDPTIPVESSTLNQTVYRLAQRPRFSAALLSLFALVGVLLAAAGIYGLVSLLVSQRTQEIAIHIALGASPAVISRKIAAQACSSIAFGAVAGIVCSLAADRSIQALLYGIRPDDPATLTESVLGLLVVAAVAAYLPARRAAKVDPMVALRYE